MEAEPEDATDEGFRKKIQREERRNRPAPATYRPAADPAPVPNEVFIVDGIRLKGEEVRAHGQRRGLSIYESAVEILQLPADLRRLYEAR